MKHVLVCVIVGVITVAAMVAAHHRPSHPTISILAPGADGACPDGYKKIDLGMSSLNLTGANFSGPICYPPVGP